MVQSMHYITFTLACIALIYSSNFSLQPISCFIKNHEYYVSQYLLSYAIVLLSSVQYISYLVSMWPVNRAAYI